MSAIYATPIDWSSLASTASPGSRTTGGSPAARPSAAAWYASIGAPEYWIVDLGRRVVERLVLEPGGDYRGAQTARHDAIFAPDSFPGLVIPLVEPWMLPA
jgi:hypothetical protein